VVAVAGSPWGVVAGDFVGPDGRLDVVVTNAALGKVTLLQGGGDGSLLPGGVFDVGAGPRDVVAADFDRDGLLDLAVANSGGTSVSVLAGTGTGFGAASSVDVADPPSRLAVADFDRDGISDLAVVSQIGGTVRVLLGNGDLTFTEYTDAVVTDRPPDERDTPDA
jgi:hypothetical protein